MDVRNRRVTVMGLGRHGGGVSAARWLAERGAEVTVTDLADESALAESLAELQDVPIARYRLGGHCEEDFRSAELVVVNPAVKPDNRWLSLPAAAGAAMTSEIELFLDACPARVVGVTGSNGKSTTAAMTAAILEADGRRVWLGGNLGGSLLGELERMTRHDWVVLELSSFQLARLSPRSRWPEAAIVVNCTPNHLDWHGDWQAYVGAKQRLLAGQTAESLVVLNTRDAEVGRWQALVRGRLLPSLNDQDVPPLAVPGEHNRQNAACAAAAAIGLGCSPQAVERGLTAFGGLPHRLELAFEADGRSFYNDSMATTPESVMAAIDALGKHAWFLVGGYDKGVDYEGLIAKLAEGARGAAFYGAVRSKLLTFAASLSTPCEFHACETLHEALERCWNRSQAGEAIVLSPACASYDQFRDYRHRAATFIEAAHALTREADHVKDLTARKNR